MPSARLVLAVAALAAGARLGADARVNASGAIEVFLISDCAECTTDKDSVYCSDSTSDDNFVSNGTLKVTTAQKKSSNPPYGVGPSAGSHFCWAGTFGQLLYANGNYPSLLNSNNVTAKLGCDSQNLFYRQCVIPTQLAIILMSFAALICVCCTTCVCL